MTYAFQNKSTLYSCLNVKELLARNRRDILSLSDSNGIRTHNNLVRKRNLSNFLGGSFSNGDKVRAPVQFRREKQPQYGGIQLLRSHLVGRGGPSKCQRMQTGGCHIRIFLIDYLVHKLLTIVTRFSVSFIKIPICLKYLFQKTYISFVSKITNQLCLLRTINLK